MAGRRPLDELRAGSSLLSALSRARSTHVKGGRGVWRRSTATSRRRTRISTSFAASDRAINASQLTIRASIRYESRNATTTDHARRPATHVDPLVKAA
jgi:hypothetical protein